MDVRRFSLSVRSLDIIQSGTYRLWTYSIVCNKYDSCWSSLPFCLVSSVYSLYLYFSLSLSLSLYLSISLSLSLSHTHAHRHTHTISLCISLFLSLSLSLSLSHSLSHPLSFCLSSCVSLSLNSCRRLAYAIDFWSKGKMEALFLAHEVRAL